MYNKIVLLGNLTRDVEIRYTQSGTAIGNCAIATSRKFKAASGEQKEEVMFIDVSFIGRSAEIANQYVRKGSKVLIEGRLKLDQWTAQDGSKRSKHSVTVENFKMLDGKPEGQSQGDGYAGGSDQYSSPAPDPAAAYSPPAAAPAPSSNIPEIDINEDEIPF